jgi:hypothetical protein
MPMTSIRTFWSQHKMASLSIITCTVETLVIWGIVITVHLSSSPSSPPRLVSIASTAWILGSILSVVFAVISIVVDSRRQIGVLAFLLAAVVFIVCGLPMLV